MLLEVLHHGTYILTGCGKQACYDGLDRASVGVLGVFDFLVVVTKSIEDAPFYGVYVRPLGAVKSFMGSGVG